MGFYVVACIVTLSLAHTHSQTHTLSHTHSQTHTLAHTHSHTHTLTLSLTHTLQLRRWIPYVVFYVVACIVTLLLTANCSDLM